MTELDVFHESVPDPNEEFSHVIFWFLRFHLPILVPLSFFLASIQLTHRVFLFFFRYMLILIFPKENFMGKKNHLYLKPKLSFNSLHSRVHMVGTPVILVRKDNESF